MKNYYLFGTEVCSIYKSGNIHDLIDHILTKKLTPIEDFTLFVFEDGKDSSIELLEVYSGWNDYASLGEEDYNLLINSI